MPKYKIMGNTNKKIEQVKKMLQDNNKTGNIYSVSFQKRTDGSVRKMICRGKVFKGLRGGTLKFNPLERDLVQVYDMRKKGYRLIPCENVISIKAKGKYEEWYY